MRTTLITLTLLALLTPVFSADLPLSESPQISLALSSKHGENANPLKLHFTRKRDKKLLAILPAYFDQAQRGAEKNTKALWSPKGDFVALAWNGGPRVGTLSVYGILPESAVEIRLADYTQNILGRHRTIQQGPHRTDTFLKWVSDDELLISTGGEADDVPDFGRVVYHYHVRLRFHALHMAEPYSELIAVSEAPKEKVRK